jgi:chromosome segregation ATPase
MAIKGTYDTIKQAIQDLIAPQLERITGEIAGLKTEVRSLEKRMEEGFTSLRGETREGQTSIRAELDSVREELRQGQAGLRGEMSSLREEIRSLREETRQGLA